MNLSDLVGKIKPFVQRWIDGALAGGVRDLGTVGQPFGTVYANTITADTVAGTLEGPEWEVSGDPVIDANVPGGTGAVYIINQGAGGVADLNVERNIIVGGTVDGVDVSDHRTRHLFGGSDALMVAQNTEPTPMAGMLWIDTDEVVADWSAPNVLVLTS